MTEKQIQQRLLEATLIEDVEIPAGLEARLLTALEQQKPAQPAATRTVPTGRSKGWAAAAAAITLALALPATGYLFNNRPAVRYTDTCNNADEARQELQSALALLQPANTSNDLLLLLD